MLLQFVYFQHKVPNKVYVAYKHEIDKCGNIATSKKARLHFKVDKSSWAIFKQMNKKRT